MSLLNPIDVIGLIIHVNIIGWAMAYITREDKRCMHLDFWAVIRTVLMEIIVLAIPVLIVPGFTHPVIVFCMLTWLLISPYLITRIEYGAQVNGSWMGETYRYLSRTLWVLSFIPTVVLFYEDRGQYWGLVIISGAALLNIVITEPGELIHRKQKGLRGKIRASSDIEH